jgi:Rrf2 family protein
MSGTVSPVALPRRTMHALAALIDIAHHGRSGPVPLKAFAERHGLPPRHLEAVMQHLVRAGLLTSARGPRGGYALARERRRITLADVVTSVGEEGARPVPYAVVIRAALAPVEAVAEKTLASVTLEDLIRQAERLGALSGPGDRADFSI